MNNDLAYNHKGPKSVYCKISFHLIYVVSQDLLMDLITAFLPPCQLPHLPVKALKYLEQQSVWATFTQ